MHRRVVELGIIERPLVADDVQAVVVPLEVRHRGRCLAGVVDDHHFKVGVQGERKHAVDAALQSCPSHVGITMLTRGGVGQGPRHAIEPRIADPRHLAGSSGPLRWSVTARRPASTAYGLADTSDAVELGIHAPVIEHVRDVQALLNRDGLLTRSVRSQSGLPFVSLAG